MKFIGFLMPLMAMALVIERSPKQDGGLVRREFEKRSCCIANFGSEVACKRHQEEFVEARKRNAEANPLFKRDAQCSGICEYNYGACFEYCDCDNGSVNEAACGGIQIGHACSG